MNRINMVINILVCILAILPAYIAYYIITNGAAPWNWIAVYWTTVMIKNGLDVIKNVRKTKI